MSRFHSMVPAACGTARRGRVSLSGLILLASSSLLLLTGCGIGNPAPAVETATQGTGIQGTAFGGRQAISGAKVYLYAAGTTGYGSAPTSLLNGLGYVTTNTDGSFGITSDYTCPIVTGGSQVYLVLTGGDAGGGVNPNLTLMSALGPCASGGTLSSSIFVNIDEISTVASAYALAQFTSYPGSDSDSPDPGAIPNIGTSSTNTTGLINAFATVNNLVDTSTGQSFTVTPAYASSINAGHVSTVPQRRINTLANILAACVNSVGGSAGDTTPCGNLFDATTPTATGVPPTDTLQAIVNLAQHQGPVSAASTELYNLSSSTAPFQPSLTRVPNDWTIALSFTGGGFLNANLGSKKPTYATALAIDATGNIWATSQGDLSGAGGGIVEFNNLGVPQSPNTTSTAWGGYPAGGTLTPTSLAIDLTGHVWVGRSDLNSGEGSINVLDQSGTQVLAPFDLGTGYALSMALDPGSSNVWASGYDLGTGFGWAAGYHSSGVPLPSFTEPSGAFSYPGLTVDHAGDVWIAPYEYNASTGALVATRIGSAGATSLSGAALVADSSGDVFGCGDDIIYKAVPASTTVTKLTTTTTAGCNTNSIGNPVMALDGAGNLWGVNSAPEGPTSTPTGNLSEVSSTNGHLLSPPTSGFTGFGGASGQQDGETGTRLLENDRTEDITGVAVDGSGNIWVLNYFHNAALDVQGALAEFVGLAAPTATPTVLAVKNNTTSVEP